jgi:AbrB family looped-hinge helix DNA binding protein
MNRRSTGIVRRLDSLGRVVLPKEIRRTMRIREGDPLFTSLTQFDRFCVAIHSISKRIKAE